MNAKRTTEKLAKQLNAVRQRRVLNIKHKIHAGRYKVDNATLAKALFMAS